jgi:hypothetical protein
MFANVAGKLLQASALALLRVRRVNFGITNGNAFWKVNKMYKTLEEMEAATRYGIETKHVNAAGFTLYVHRSRVVGYIYEANNRSITRERALEWFARPENQEG